MDLGQNTTQTQSRVFHSILLTLSLERLKLLIKSLKLDSRAVQAGVFNEMGVFFWEENENVELWKVGFKMAAVWPAEGV